MRRPLAGSALLSLAALPAAGQAPLGYLQSFGSPADEVRPLLWALLALAIIVIVVIALLVLAGLILRLRLGVDMAADTRAVRRRSEGGAMRWIYGGLALTTLILVAFTVWTVSTLAAIGGPGDSAALTVDVTGHQWWWEVEYDPGSPDRLLQTANEIRVPVGEPVRFRLASADVIHSFWVPALGGKTDLIPGQINTAWLEADAPGIYRGRCAEYCGLQHANMALRVVALPRDEFDAWYRNQLQDAAPPEEPEAVAGQQEFVENCAACHTVRGTIAGGEMGPDLTHLMSRGTLASATFPNTEGHLAGWIANPQRLKPGTTMPNPDLSGPELDAVRSYLLTLD